MIHYSNVKCDECGYRHTPDDMEECRDCVLKDLANLREMATGSLQRCVDAMTTMLDTEVLSSPHWVELRLARDAAQHAIVDECSG